MKYWTTSIEYGWSDLQPEAQNGMVVAAQNTNNTTIRSILMAEKLTGSKFTNWYRNLRIVLENEKKINISSDLQRTLEKYNAFDMIQELKTMFEEQAKQELIKKVKAFHACKQEDGHSVSSYLLKMKSYLDTLEHLGYAMPKELGMSFILNSLNKDYDQFVQNYNMHSMGKTIDELHAMLKLHEKGAKGKAKGKNKLAYAPKTKIPLPPKRDNLAKDSIFHHYKEVGHCRRNFPSYHAELKKRKNASVASTSSIFTIELNAFSNNIWVYDTGCGTHICNTSQGLRRSRKLKHGALSLYMGNGMRTVVEAIRSFDLILPSGLIVVLDNCHFSPTVTRAVVLISRLVKNGYIHTFANYGISVSKDNVFYFNAIPYDGHCRLRHINKKRMDMLQRDGLLQPTHDESHEKSRILNMVLTKKVDRTPYEIWHWKAPKLSYLKVWGCEALVKQDTPDKLDSRSARIPQAPDRYGYHVDIEEYELGDFDELPNYKATLADPQFEKWLKAMNTKMQSTKDNQVWILVELPPNGQTVRNIRAIRILLAIAAFYDYEIWQMDVKTAFLKGNLCEDEYMVKPEGFVDPKHPNKVCKLQHSMYGLKQTSRSWNKRFDEEIKKISFTQNLNEPCVYLKASGSNVAFLVLYVNDILLMGNSVTMLKEVKSWLCKCYSMKYLGEAAYILEIKIIHDRSKRFIALSQSAYLEKIIKKFKMENSKKGYTLMMEKPDYRKSQVAKTPTEQNPGDIHWTAVKTILKYLSNTKDMVLMYGEKPEDELKVSCYADAKAEYIAIAEASMEVVWMRKFIDGLGGVMPSNKRPMEMLCNNEPALAIASDPGILKGARYFPRKYHYIREVIHEGEIFLKKVHAYDNVVDPFTKPMPFNKHFEHAMAIGIIHASSLM
ncbi:retrotransposon protein, putative, ty1-copia subclass [Tanacetum coccineum]